MNLDEFVLQAADHGPFVGVYLATQSPLEVPAKVELRTVDGAHTKTLNALFDAFAEAWHFPPWFGRNPYAFDDFMRDLDNMINTAAGKPPAPGYLTDIINAHLILNEQRDVFLGSPIQCRSIGITIATKPIRPQPSACRFRLPPVNSTKSANGDLLSAFRLRQSPSEPVWSETAIPSASSPVATDRRGIPRINTDHFIGFDSDGTQW